jgi:hypothetical protein
MQPCEHCPSAKVLNCTMLTVLSEGCTDDKIYRALCTETGAVIVIGLGRHARVSPSTIFERLRLKLTDGHKKDVSGVGTKTGEV